MKLVKKNKSKLTAYNDQAHVSDVSDVDPTPQVNQERILQLDIKSENLIEIISNLMKRMNRNEKNVTELTE